MLLTYPDHHNTEIHLVAQTISAQQYYVAPLLMMAHTLPGINIGNSVRILFDKATKIALSQLCKV